MARTRKQVVRRAAEAEVARLIIRAEQAPKNNRIGVDARIIHTGAFRDAVADAGDLQGLRNDRQRKAQPRRRKQNKKTFHKFQGAGFAR